MSISTILSAGSCLVDSKPSHTGSDLKAVLLSRLSEYYKRLGREQTIPDCLTLEDVEVKTADEALHVVEQVQKVLADNSGDASGIEEAPTIGTRDLARLRILIQMIFKWGIDILLPPATSAWSSMKTSWKSRQHPEMGDVFSMLEPSLRLSTMTCRLINLLFPGEKPGSVPQTLITTVLINRHLADLLSPCIALGWLPSSLTVELMRPPNEFRSLVLHLLTILSPSQTISALGSLLSGQQLLPDHARRACASLLTQQLLRPEGVRGLCDAVFGEENIDDTPLEKLEHVARVLSTVPAATQPEEYFRIMSPRIVTILSGVAAPSHKRAAAFALSRMLTPGSPFSHQALVCRIVLPILHRPFLEVPSDHPGLVYSRSGAHLCLSPRQVLSTLMTILTNTDPSPFFISTLVSPILSPLYALLSHLDRNRTSNPQLKESLKGILATWGRIVSSQEGVDVLWTVVEDQCFDWEIDGQEEIKRCVRSRSLSAPSLLTPEDLRRQTESDNDDLDLNLFDLYPDPIHFVQFVISFGRSDIYSGMFFKSLDAYRLSKAKQDSDPLRALLYLQLVMQMQTKLADRNESSNILQKPEYILSFVKHVLGSVTTPASDIRPSRDNRPEDVFRLDNAATQPAGDALCCESDSDDEDDVKLPFDDDMTETAINLLLSVLEANENLSAHTAPVLSEIFDLLDPIANNLSHPARPAAREALMVVTARLASTSDPCKLAKSQEGFQETYDRALKLLQDPILPVRAHGLLLLRQTITSSQDSEMQSFVPAVLSVFLQFIQDDDPYMFLNAVQGLSAMVDKFGGEVLRGLMDRYARGMDGPMPVDLTQHEVDTRLRIAEALGQVIRRYGEALVIYVDILVPRLFNMIRFSQVPTVLRSSALSLLAECEHTHPLSLLHYSSDLASAMVELLQVETVAARPPEISQTEPSSADGAQSPLTIDSHPTSTNSKLPPLRRAALHFLLRLVNQATTHVDDPTFRGLTISLKRAHTTIAYVASTDEDAVVRVMAREVLEAIKTLGQAMLGI